MISEENRPVQRLEDLEREAIEHAVRFYSGHKVKAAEALGISVKTLYRKLQQYGYRRGRLGPTGPGGGTG